VRLPDSLIEKAKIRAVKEKMTLQGLVAEALEFYLFHLNNRLTKRAGE
jgi:predicted DNA binding CopG/RHH family protein